MAVTKGNANHAGDELFEKKRTKGVTAEQIPSMGGAFRILKTPSGVLLALALVFCLTAVNLSLIWRGYAKYTGSARGVDEARAARFEVTESGKVSRMDEIEIAPGETYSFPVEIVNKSETAVGYRITGESQYGNLPLTFEFCEKNDADYGEEEMDPVWKSGSVTGEIGAGDRTPRIYMVRVGWDQDIPGNKDPEYAGKTELWTVTLEAEQLE